RLLALFANLAPCTVGLEACSGAHQLARELTAMGHTVRIIAAKFVAPHRTSGKNDHNDARAIVDALLVVPDTRPSLLFRRIGTLVHSWTGITKGKLVIRSAREVCDPHGFDVFFRQGRQIPWRKLV